MTPSEHLVNMLQRAKLRVEGEKLALERDARTLSKCQEAYQDTKERLEEAEAEYTAFLKILLNSNDQELLIAYRAKL